MRFVYLQRKFILGKSLLNNMAKIKVQNTEVTIITYDNKDYISLTDMVRNIENGLSLIEKWYATKT